MAGDRRCGKLAAARLKSDSSTMVTSKQSKNQQLKECALILGMHRSGTSALAGVLTKLGCKAPVHEMPASKGNAKGFFESIPIRDLNDEILASAGSSWDDVTCFPDSWLQSAPAGEFLDRAAAILEQEFGNAQLFVLKDPRICRLVPFWIRALETFGCTAKPIITLRNPLEVGRSLRAKKGFEEPLSQLIWLRYTLDAEAETRGRIRFFTTFEQLLEGWGAVAEAAQDKLQLVWPKPIANVEIDVEKFLADDLRHQKESSNRALTSSLLPQWLRQTYEILGNWARNGERSEDYPQLDRIRAEFDTASNAFARIVRAERNKTADVKETLRQLQSQCADLQARADQANAIEKERDALRQRDTGLTAELEDAKARSGAFEAECKDLQARIDAAETQRREFEARVLHQDEEREALQQKLTAVAESSERQRDDHAKAMAEQKTVSEQAQASLAAAEQRLQDAKDALQQQRRRSTLLDAERQRAQDVVDALGAELAEAQAESAASRSRRKEMARVITNREEKIAALRQELQARYEELSLLERQLLRSSPSWLVKTALRRLRRFAARTFSSKRPAAS